ncbi:hypothetical protein G6L37_06415 [Agrobacterium rubi]|nr:hypothetical protein [Agrobacterium rubi]NTF24996.1 hypothetical protein [Agrobacterium rubi]
MGKKSKDKEVSSEARNWVPGWFGGLTSPAAQETTRTHRDALRSRIIAFEAARRGNESAPTDCESVFRR